MIARNALNGSDKNKRDFIMTIGAIVILLASTYIALDFLGVVGRNCPKKPETKFMYGQVEHVQPDFLTGNSPYTIRIDGFESTSPSAHIQSVGFWENIIGKIEKGDYIVVYVEWECTEACIDPDWHYWIPYAEDWTIIEEK